MRCHKIEVADDEGYILATRYAATGAEARTLKEELRETFKVKRNQVTAEKAEIPVAKAELLAFINEILTESDYTGENEEEAGDE